MTLFSGRGYGGGGGGGSSGGGASFEQQQIQDTSDYGSAPGGASGYNQVPSSGPSSDSQSGGKKIQIVYIKGMLIYMWHSSGGM